MKYFFKLSSLCREIAWDAIVLGGNKHFPGGVHYPAAIFLVAIIWGYISVVNIILRGNSLSASCPRANYLGDNFRASNFRGAIIREANVRGAIVLFPVQRLCIFLLSIFNLLVLPFVFMESVLCRCFLLFFHHLKLIYCCTSPNIFF